MDAQKEFMGRGSEVANLTDRGGRNGQRLFESKRTRKSNPGKPTAVAYELDIQPTSIA